MFTVAELVDQGYTEKHARQFLQRERVQHNNGKATLKARRDEVKPKVLTIVPDALETELPTLKDRMLTVQSQTVEGSRRDKRNKQQLIRDWAQKHGHQVSNFGKIPDSIVQEYEHAHEQKK